MAGEESGSSDFGTLLRRFRLAAGLSQEVLAERARLSANGIGALERGYRRAPHRETLGLLVGALALDEEQRREFEAAAARGKAALRAGMPIDARRDGALAGLPLALTSFVGRSTELDAIARLVREHRLVTLTGAGGIGKTQTALRAAAALDEDCSDSVCFVGLAPLTERSMVVAAIAAAVGVQELPDHPLLETLTGSLRHRPLLLILDNCEHVVTEAARVAEHLLSSCPRLRILATSREPLRCAGERNYRLPSLTPGDALALFADRARAADHRFTLNDANAAAAADICRRLDGIPLAIELAAARANVLSVKTLNERLSDHLETLGSGERTASPRQQTMVATIGWSYDLLSAPEQRVFERLSVFAGGCTLELATAVCADREVPEGVVLDLLMSLVDKSLLVADVDRRETRFSLLEPFRQYARERLARRREERSIAHRHASAFLALAAQLDSDYDAEADRVRDVLREELGNWRAALLWALAKRGDAPSGRQLVGRLNVLWQMMPLEGRRWMAAARRLDQTAVPASTRAALNYADAIIAGALREFEVELASSESALRDFRTLRDALGVAGAQSVRCAALICLGRPREARTLLAETLALAKSARNRHLLAYTFRCFAFSIGTNRPAARRCLTKALRLYEAANDRFMFSRALSELGGCELVADRNEQGLAHITTALAIAREFNDVTAIARDLGELAFNLIGLSRYDEAQIYAMESLELALGQRLEYSIVLAVEFLVAIAVLRPRVLSEATLDAYTRAARALGFANARFTALHSGRNADLQATYDFVVAPLREAIGADRLAKLMLEGAEMSEEEAVNAAVSSAAAAP